MTVRDGEPPSPHLLDIESIRIIPMPIQPINTAVSVWTASRVPKIDTEKLPPFAHDGHRRLWGLAGSEIVARAGVQSGKTLAAPYKLLRMIARTAWLAKYLKPSAAIYLYLGPTLKLLQAQAIPGLIELFETEHRLGRFVWSPHPRFVFSADGKARIGIPTEYPCEVRFCYASDSNNLESVTALGACWDEADQDDNVEASLYALDSRLSIARGMVAGYWDSQEKKWVGMDFVEGDKRFQPVMAGECFYTTSPYGSGWFERTVEARAEKAGTLVSWESWLNPLQDKARIMALRDEMPAWYWSMRYEGKRTRPAGAVYDNLDPEIDCIAPLVFPAHWACYTGHDFGKSNMAAVFCAVKPEGEPWPLPVRDVDGNIVMTTVTDEVGFFYDTYHAGGYHVREHVQKIKYRAGQPIKASWGGAPSEDEWRSDFGRAGLPIRPPRQDKPENQIARFYRQISLRRVRFVKGTGAMKLYDEMGQYVRVLDDSYEPTKKIKDEEKFHRHAGARYLVSSLWPEQIAEPKPRPYKMPEVRQI